MTAPLSSTSRAVRGWRWHHLLAQGCRSIAHVTGPRRHRAAVDRARGAADELSEAGVRPVGRTAYGSWSESWGREFTATPAGRAPAGGRHLLRKRSDCPGRHRRTPRSRAPGAAGHCSRRLRQLGRDGAGQPAAAVLDRHEHEPGRPAERRLHHLRNLRRSRTRAHQGRVLAWSCDSPVTSHRCLPAPGRAVSDPAKRAGPVFDRRRALRPASEIRERPRLRPRPARPHRVRRPSRAGRPHASGRRTCG